MSPYSPGKFSTNKCHHCNLAHQDVTAGTSIDYGQPGDPIEMIVLQCPTTDKSVYLEEVKMNGRVIYYALHGFGVKWYRKPTLSIVSIM